MTKEQDKIVTSILIQIVHQAVSKDLTGKKSPIENQPFDADWFWKHFATLVDEVIPCWFDVLVEQFRGDHEQDIIKALQERGC